MSTIPPNASPQSSPGLAPPPPRRPLAERFGCFTVIGFIVAGFAVLLAILAVFVFGATAGPVKAANAFFAATPKSSAAAAYALTSPAFRASTSEAAFEAVAAQKNLVGVQKATWNSRGVLNGVATLGGHLHYANGSTEPVAVKLTKGASGGWEIQFLDIGSGAAATIADATSATTNSPLAATSVAPVAPLAAPSAPPPASGVTGQVDSSTVTSLGSPSGDTALQQGTASPSLPPGRAGPPGSVLASGQVAPNCLVPLRQQGFAADNVDCPLYLPTRPGATEQCVATGGGRRVGVTVTFLDYEPTTRSGSVDCRINGG